MHVSRARAAARLAIATTLTTALTAALATTPLLSGGPAEARPVVSPPTAPDPREPVLRPGTLVDLAPGARDVQVAESPGGGAVAITWSVRSSSGNDEVWVRLKDENAWAAKVRVSDPLATATRASMDLDSDGSLLVAWHEQRGSSRSVVSRRVSGATAGARKVFAVTAADGPYVGAGALHDVVVWTASSGGVVRPFASVDHGAGFAHAVAVSSNGWTYDVLPGSIAVNADSQQVHVTYLSRDTDAGAVQSSWSVLESTKGSSWVPSDDLGPRQELGAPLRPMVAVDDRGVAVLVLHDLSEDQRQPYPSARLYDPLAPGASPRDRLGEPIGLSAGDFEDEPRTLLGVRNRRNVLVAAYSGSPALIKQLVLPSEPGWTFADWTGDALCMPYTTDSSAGVWFFTWRQQSAEIHCLDDQSTPGSVGILYNNFFPALSTISPDTTLGGSIKGFVPDPLVSMIVLTEDVVGTNDPVWVLDHTDGGNDKPAPLLDFAKLKHPSITGTPQVGKTFRAVTGRWRPAPSEVAYRWFVNGRIVKGATRATLKLTRAHQGKRISVRLYLSRAGYKDRVVEAKRVQKIKAKPKPKRKKKR